LRQRSSLASGHFSRPARAILRKARIALQRPYSSAVRGLSIGPLELSRPGRPLFGNAGASPAVPSRGRRRLGQVPEAMKAASMRFGRWPAPWWSRAAQLEAAMSGAADDQSAGGIRATDAERDATVGRLSRSAGDGRPRPCPFSRLGSVDESVLRQLIGGAQHGRFSGPSSDRPGQKVAGQPCIG